MCFSRAESVSTDYRYVLSPTHLHEFKSADRLPWQTPVMSLYLPEQKIGSHSQSDSSSHKFMLKGRQTGAMHRGHGWVFRAESHDTMMAWYDNINNLIGKTGEARNAFVRRHIRSMSGSSQRPASVSSDGAMDEDEADRTPYSGHAAILQRASSVAADAPPPRPQPGGRFPSDVQIERHLHAPLSQSSGDSSRDREAIANTTTLPGSVGPYSADVNAVSPIERPDLVPSTGSDKNLAPTTSHDQQYTPRYQAPLNSTLVHLSNPPYNYDLSSPSENPPVVPSRRYSERNVFATISQQAYSQQLNQQHPSSRQAQMTFERPDHTPNAVDVAETPPTSYFNEQYSQQSAVDGQGSGVSRYSQSTSLGMGSSPVSTVVTSPLSTELTGSVTGVMISEAQPLLVTKASSSTMDLPGMPGMYP